MDNQNNGATSGVLSAEDRSFGHSNVKKARRVRSRKALKIVLVTLIAILLVLSCTFAAILMPLLQAYNKSYSKVPIIVPPESFVVPDFPDNPNGTYPHIGENGNWWVGDIDTGIQVEYLANPETDENGEEKIEAINVPVVGEGGNWMIGGKDTGIKSDVSTDIPEPGPEDTTDYEDDDPIYSGGKPVTVTGIHKVEQKDPDIENILLVGTDSRNMSSLKGRSDTMIVFSYNKRTGEGKLISFMRDTLVPIQGLGANGAAKWQRLNATFSLIGIASTVNTINQVFGLDIQRFVIVNFEGTQRLVDACGGVDLKLTNVPGDTKKGEVQYIIACGGKVIDNGDGTYHLDGISALIHMRHRYGSSDFQRTQRQRNALMAIFRQVVSSRDVTEIYDLVREGFGMIQTNIPLDEMIDLAIGVASNGANMKIGSHRIPTTYKSISFNMSSQQVVPYGTSGAASVLQIDTALQKSKVQEIVYGK